MRRAGRLKDSEKGGVAGGVRTLDHWNHNPALYQLSYSHHTAALLV